MPDKLSKENERLLRIAQEALEECNKLHEATGHKKIPLDEVAKNLIIDKEEIQHGFDILVEMGVIGDDGDRDHMNYDEDGTLMTCVDKRGSIVGSHRYLLSDLLNPQIREQYFIDRAADVAKCSGCYYNHSWQVEHLGNFDLAHR